MEGSDWRALHPASVLVNLIPTAWRAIRSMWPLAIALVWGGVDSEVAVLEGALLVVLLGLPIWRTVIHWATLRYRVAEGRLEIRSGVLNRQVRVISPDRIQNVELVRNLFHRVSGLVELRVETASGTEVEGSLSALSESEAQRLMAALQAARASSRPAAPEATGAPPLAVNGPADLLRFGLSTARLGLVVVALGAIYELAITSDPGNVQDRASAIGVVGSAIVLVTLVLGAWLFGAVTALTRHWGFALSEVGDRLVAEEGLFTRRRVELALDKVQLVTLSEPIARRMLGFGSLFVETAALREGGGGTATSEAMVPVVEAERFDALVRAALPDAPALGSLALMPPHPLALRRALGAVAVRNSILAAIAGVVFWPWGLVAWSLVPAGLFGAWLDHRTQGWWLGPGHVVSRTGWWVRTTRIVAREKLQALELVQGPIARRWGLARLHLRVAGSAVALPVLAFDDALDLELELSASVARRRDGLGHDHQAPGEQQPGQPLVHEAHQDQAREQRDLGGHPPDRPADGPERGERPEQPGEDGGDPEDERHRVGGSVEARLPSDVHPDLEPHQRRVDHDERPDEPVPDGDDRPPEGHGDAALPARHRPDEPHG